MGRGKGREKAAPLTKINAEAKLGYYFLIFFERFHMSVDENDAAPATDEIASNAADDPAQDFYVIDEEAIKRWLKIPVAAEVQISLSRGDFDSLFFSMASLFNSQINLHQTMVEQSLGNLEEANSCFRAARHATAEANNKFRKFFESIIKNAVAGDAE